MTSNKKLRLVGALLAVPVVLSGLAAGLLLLKTNLDNRRQAATDITWSPFYSADTHPYFWAVDGARWVGKAYKHLPGTKEVGYDVLWSWSYPYRPDDIANPLRVVEWSFGNMGGATEHHEWELWKQDGHDAVMYKFAGYPEDRAGASYPNQAECQADLARGVTGLTYQVNSGMRWPGFPSGVASNWSPISHKRNAGLCPPEKTAGRNGGHIAHEMYDWSPPQSPKRYEVCGRYIPKDQYTTAYAICLTAPDVAIVYQHYAGADTWSAGGPYIAYGVEAVVYVWGYSKDADKHYQNWFRNGELRLSGFTDCGSYNLDYVPGRSFWAACEQKAWDQQDNWIYTGNWFLNVLPLYMDDAVVPPPPTPVPTPTPCPATAVPTNLSPSGTVQCETTSLTFSWTGVAGATGYHLRIDDQSDGWVGSNDTIIDNYASTSYSRPVQPGHSYRTWVHSVNACGQNSAETAATVTVPVCPTPTPCPAIGNPVNLTPAGTLACNTRPTQLSWSPVAGAVRYQVIVDDMTNGWNSSCSNLNPGDFCDTTTATSYPIAVTLGKSYRYWVAAQNDCGNWSSQITQQFSTSICPTPTPTPAPTPTPTPAPTPTPTPTAPPVKTGDANGDGEVDRADYGIWLNRYGQSVTGGASMGDFNGDHKADGLDYILWLNNYGK